jgi:hypothetical protein
MAFKPERRRADPNKAWTGTERRKGEPHRDPIMAGGLIGKGVAETIDPTAEEAYWSQNYTREPYYERGYTFADYHPGYRTGWEGRARYEGRTFDEVEKDLEFDYARNRGKSRLEWEKNRHAARAAWERFDPDSEPLEGSH